MARLPDGAQLDPLARLLHASGTPTETAYFGQSHVVIGRRLQLDQLALVYRLEGERLLICEFEARGGPRGLDGALARLVALIRRIERELDAVKEVRGLIQLTFADPALNRLRRRLRHALLGLGATAEGRPHAQWLTYRLRRC